MSLDELIDQLCDFRDSFGGRMPVKLHTTHVDFETAREFPETYDASDSCVRTRSEGRYIEISAE